MDSPDFHFISTPHVNETNWKEIIEILSSITIKMEES